MGGGLGKAPGEVREDRLARTPEGGPKASEKLDSRRCENSIVKRWPRGLVCEHFGPILWGGGLGRATGEAREGE